MTGWFFILALLSLVAFLLAAFNVPRFNWIAIGLALFAAILVLQYGKALAA
jgi:hypothetical protein